MLYIDDDFQLHYNLQSSLDTRFYWFFLLRIGNYGVFVINTLCCYSYFWTRVFSLYPNLMIEYAFYSYYVHINGRYHPTRSISNIYSFCTLFGLPTFNCACTQRYFPYFVYPRLNIRCLYFIVDIIILHRKKLSWLYGQWWYENKISMIFHTSLYRLYLQIVCEMSSEV